MNIKRDWNASSLTYLSLRTEDIRPYIKTEVLPC